ncbi:SOH1-domain-containing protein [Xylogone sp. PMI_703]|nr:SOH1-domain-containing protein [Xylogone sp. PMI_703]
MASNDAGAKDITMRDRQPPSIPAEPKFGGFTRFEIELEFVQSLSNPFYLNHLAVQKYLESPPFIAYLAYLQYFAQPPYTKYLTYPGPTLRNLELLQQERFRAEILSPDVVARLVEEGVKAGMTYPGR